MDGMLHGIKVVALTVGSIYAEPILGMYVHSTLLLKESIRGFVSGSQLVTSVQEASI